MGGRTCFRDTKDLNANGRIERIDTNLTCRDSCGRGQSLVRQGPLSCFGTDARDVPAASRASVPKKMFVRARGDMIRRTTKERFAQFAQFAIFAFKSLVSFRHAARKSRSSGCFATIRMTARPIPASARRSAPAARSQRLPRHALRLLVRQLALRLAEQRRSRSTDPRADSATSRRRTAPRASP